MGTQFTYLKFNCQLYLIFSLLLSLFNLNVTSELKVESELIISELRFSESNCSCQNYNKFVLVAPGHVEIRGPSTAKVGQALIFECGTSNSNPASTLQWVIDGKAQPAINNITRLKTEVFSLEKLKKDFGSEKSGQKNFWLGFFLVLNTFWVKKKFRSKKKCWVKNLFGLKHFCVRNQF